MDEAEDIQEPQDHGNHNNSIQDGLDDVLHWDVAIDKPQENTQRQ
jgi:hypothetical protein